MSRFSMLLILLLPFFCNGDVLSQETQRKLPREDVIDVPAIDEGLSVSNVFQTNMVLQRDTDINVWGWADPNEELTITIGETKVTTTADDKGTWSVQVAAPETGGPYDLIVSGLDASVVFKNVLVGEVWICAGQSNMEWPLIDSIEFENDEAREQFISSINDAKMRLYSVPQAALDKPASDFTEPSVWQECTPDTIGNFSGVAYFFAHYLRQSSKLAEMPIGLIKCSYSGTPCESWTSREALKSDEVFQPLLEQWDANSDDRGPNRPSSLFNGMVSPLAPMSVRGVIWYQGESNVGRGQQYAHLFPAMIKDWRGWFKQGDIPFYYVQLAPFRYTQSNPQALAEVWDAQVKSLRVPNTGMVATVDIGNPQDIHPKNKKVVGQRLAMLARSHTYGETDLACFGPAYLDKKISGDRIIIEFRHSEGLKSSGSEVTGFTICGDDQQFVPAKAEIRDGKVVVWSDQVPKPTEVRYLWDDSATASLFNGAGLPASPFRTDNFDLLSKDRHF